MHSNLKKQAEALAALSANDRVCLERLAALAKITPDELWPEVWQYGFNDVEESIQADLKADEYFRTHPGIDNVEVMSKARSLVAAYAKPKRKTGLSWDRWRLGGWDR